MCWLHGEGKGRHHYHFYRPPLGRARARMLAETVYTVLLYARLYLSSLVSRVGIFYFGFVLVEPTMTKLAFLVTVTLTLRRLMSYTYIYIYIYIYMEHPFLMFLDHTQRRSTVGRTPLDE